MPNPANDAIIRDATPLYTAIQSLLGYRLSLRFREVLTGLLGRIRAWSEAGLFDQPGRPNAQFQRVCLDFNAIDLEPLWDLCGTFFYLLASHKSANFRMMHPASHPHVLYLRGFDYDAAVSVGDSLATGLTTIDDAGFLRNLEAMLTGQAALFKVMSPRDLELETLAMERLFRGDYGRIINAAKARTYSFYVNAQYWKDDVAFVAQRVDAFVVYVSSISASARWELDHLLACGLSGQTTVVFDRHAIHIKATHSNIHEHLPQIGTGEVLSRPSAMHSTDADIDALHNWLTQHFTVMDAETFEQHADALVARINANGHGRSKAASESYLPFRFYPAVDPAVLAKLRRLDAALWSEIDPKQAGDIDCLPFHLNQVQLRVVTALLLGAYAEAGRALAAFAGCVGGAFDHYTAAGHIVEGQPKEIFEGYIEGLAELRNRLLEIAWSFLASGSENEFGDVTAAARATIEPIESAARQRACNFLERKARDGGITIVLPEDRELE